MCGDEEIDVFARSKGVEGLKVARFSLGQLIITLCPEILLV